MSAAIEVKNLTKIFPTRDGETVAANQISFSVEKGDIFGIIGLSGAGKSTLVRCLNLLEQPTEGDIYVDGKNLTTLSRKELRLMRREIGMIFQGYNLLMQKTVLQNVCFPLSISGMPHKDAVKKAMEYLDIVGLTDKANAYPATLSGGQKQRVAIARVLASNPKILLCDEATSALDPETTKSILSLLRDINKVMGITIILITHEMSVVEEICHNVLVLDCGRIAEMGSVETLFHSPKTEAARRLLVSGHLPVPTMSGGRHIRITFQETDTMEPIIANLILQFKQPVNILFADMKDFGGRTKGQMILELPKDDFVALSMTKYFRERGLTVEEWTKNVD